MSTTHTDGACATTPVIVDGVVYVQDPDSDVFAISLATGKVSCMRPPPRPRSPWNEVQNLWGNPA